jgi:hypothetical protein
MNVSDALQTSSSAVWRPTAVVAHVRVGVPRAVGDDRPPPTGKINLMSKQVVGRARIVEISVAFTDEEDPVEPLDLVLGFIEGSGLDGGVQLHPIADEELLAGKPGLVEASFVDELEACGRPGRACSPSAATSAA